MKVDVIIYCCYYASALIYYYVYYVQVKTSLTRSLARDQNKNKPQELPGNLFTFVFLFPKKPLNEALHVALRQKLCPAPNIPHVYSCHRAHGVVSRSGETAAVTVDLYIPPTATASRTAMSRRSRWGRM